MSYNFNGSTTTSITSGTGIVYQYVTDGISINTDTLAKTPSSRKRIGPKLYFSYVKSKLNKVEKKKLKSRLSKLQSLVKNAEETGQKALYEEFSKMLITAVRESEAAACGYDVFVNQEDIQKYKHLVSENDENYSSPIRFKKLEEFPRALPAKVKKVVKSVQAKGIFDELWVLYLDYTGEVIKSNKEKIREKDPILFGKFSYDEKRHYFITDWVDEYCDLTLSSFVDTLKKDDEEYELKSVEDLTPEYLERIKEEIKERDERLRGTNPGNYRERMKEEDLTELKRLREENAKLREDERLRDEDREVAIEKAIREERTHRSDAAIERLNNGKKRRAEWREKASKELQETEVESVDPLISTNKPWYKRLFS